MPVEAGAGCMVPFARLGPVSHASELMRRKARHLVIIPRLFRDEVFDVEQNRRAFHAPRLL
tara:strand:- start:2888 stop:3070 length:183 start_codon:yes stop_codon:yes gene_type:complete